MSRKTKAELEAENAELRSLVAELEHDSQNLRGHIKLLNQEWVEDHRYDKIEAAAIQDITDKAIAYHDAKMEAQHKLARHGKGPRTKQEKDKEKSDYCTEQYAQLLAEGIPHGKARTKANKATAKEFGTGLKKSALYVHCPIPSADK